MIDSIGFDLDGTLWNSVAQVTQAYNIIRDQEGLPHVTEQQIAGIMGKLFEGVAADLNPGSSHGLRPQAPNLTLNAHGSSTLKSEWPF